MSREIYVQFHGKMMLMEEPRFPERANYVITYKGKDWSGFRTIGECRAQFSELESRSDAMQDNFAVVER